MFDVNTVMRVCDGEGGRRRGASGIDPPFPSHP